MPPRATPLVFIAALAVGCHRAAPPPPTSEVAPAAPTPHTCPARSALAAVAPTGSSSSLALATLGARRVALLADEDDRALKVIELAPIRGRVLASVPLGASPGHVVVARDGRVIVSLPSADSVIELSAESDGTLFPCAQKSVPREPIALALTDDDRTLAVVSRAERALTLLPRGDGIATSIALSRDPEGVLLDGGSAYVAHGVGSIVSVVSLTERLVAREISFAWRDRIVLSTPENGTVVVGDMPRFAAQGRALAKVAGRIVVPMVLAYPGDGRLHVTMGNGYGPLSVRGIDGYFPHEPALASLPGEGAQTPFRIHLRNETVAERAQRSSAGRVAPSEPPCLLPRSIASVGASVVVACAGIDRLLVIRDGDLAHALRVPLPSGAMAVAADAGDAVVWSRFARVLSVVTLTLAGDGGSAAAIPVEAERPLDATWAEGRKTFHAPLGFDGRACASCHPDGREDGLVWSSPHGPMQAPALAGRLRESAPFGWLGKSSTLEDHLGQTMMRIGAKPMTKEAMAPLVAYVRSLPAPAPALRGDAHQEARVRRGRELFLSADVGCAGCHYDEGRMGDGLVHDLGTGGAIDTPSLIGVASSAPYMHDGRFATLRQALAATSGTMGTTKQLSERDLSALLAYLETL